MTHHHYFRVTLLSISLIAFIIIVIVLIARNKQTIAPTSNTNLCQSPVCKSAGMALNANLNDLVDPCHDFYAFACGGWEASHTLPDDNEWYNNFNILSDNVSHAMRISLSKNWSTSDSNAVTYASDLYKACIDEGFGHSFHLFCNNYS